MDIAEGVEAEFSRSTAMQVVSHAELFGGKICAALDRQHPRDLFDVHNLLSGEGYTNEIRQGFITALISHSRPLHEIIHPNFLDQRHVFESQFTGMTQTSFSYANFEATRERLVMAIRQGWTDADRAFLIGFKKAEPDWSLIPLENLSRMPAVQWKLANIRKLLKQNPKKHVEQLEALEKRLNHR
jgi:hypothetical protein